jgi:hypothetical protein
MRRIKGIFLLLAPLLLTSFATAQAGDWQAVKNLQRGTKISVLYSGPFRSLCMLESATDEQLLCEKSLHSSYRGFIRPERVYKRTTIREVRLEHGDGANTAIGAAIGGGIGAGLGASIGNSTLTRGAGAVVLGTVGAGIGGAFGRDFPVFHGKVVYRR